MKTNYCVPVFAPGNNLLLSVVNVEKFEFDKLVKDLTDLCIPFVIEHQIMTYNEFYTIKYGKN